ncbi:ATP-binding protein [Uliginosibacterium sp. sgz301328]|uniref:ATP-binding protein n=1 Tax=Uliginosibacterium sp. sgz301328 TaxID=3243764 RepID=UPI00359DD230
MSPHAKPPHHGRPAPLGDFLLALVAVGVATLIRQALDSHFGTRLPYAAYYPAIAAVCWIGTVRAAFLSVGLSTAAAWIFFVQPEPSFTLPDGEAAAGLAAFFITGLAVALLAVAQARARAKISVLHEREQVQREWLEVTLQSIGDAVIATDGGGKVRFLNPTAETLTGWTADDARGRALEEVFEIVNEDTREPALSPHQRVLRSGAIVGLSNHTLLVARDGTETPIGDSAAPIFRSDGSIEGVVLVFREARSERERERLLIVAQAAREQAEEATRMKDEFLATVSHELRGPLNAIMGWAEALTRVTDPQSLARGLMIIQNNVRAQARLVDDILDVSSIVAGKLRLERDILDPAQLLRECTENVRAVAERKGIRLTTELEPEARLMWADASRLRQVFDNIYSNAVKFTPTGGRIHTVLRQHDTEAEISFTDTGKGISPEFIGYLFDRFRQADASIRRAQGGLGLGLAIARSIVEIHGGRIQAESRGEGQGTTIRLYLPSDLEPSGGERRTASGTIVAQDPDRFHELEGANILIVEDDPDISEALAATFRRHGSTVRTAATAMSALDEFKREPPQALVSDIGLPQRDGYWMMEKIRHAESLAGIAPVPAVAVTAYGRPEDRDRGRRAGFQLHLEKPVSPDDVAAHVSRLLRKVLAG